MKTEEIRYYHVQTPEVTFTFLGGRSKPGSPGRVWLCKPDGEPVFEVPADCVKPTTRQETAKRIQADLRSSKSPLN